MTRLHLHADVAVHRAPADVFGYLSDFRLARQWRSEVVASAMSPEGPMRAGSRLREVAVIAGRQVVTDSVVTGFQAGAGFTFGHVDGPLPVSGSYRVTPTGPDGCRVDYWLDVELVGRWALLAPVFRITGPRTMASSLDELRYRLESAAVRPRIDRRSAA